MSHWTDKYAPPIACNAGYDDARQYDTPADWWANCKQSDWMLWLLNHEGYSDQKMLRTLALRFARRVEYLMTDQRGKDALDAVERYINEQATEKELAVARDRAWKALIENESAKSRDKAEVTAAEATRATRNAAFVRAIAAAHSAAGAAVGAVVYLAGWGVPEWVLVCVAARSAERKAQADIIRELIPATEIEKLISKETR